MSTKSLLCIPRRRPRSIHANRRGAVLVEFVVALMPLLITFFSFVQLAQIMVAHLMVKHATIIGARAAAVISNENKNTPDQPKGNNQAEIEKAVDAGLGVWKSDEKVRSVTVAVGDLSSCNDPYGAVTVTVDAVFNCRVPLGRLICGAGTHNIKESYAFPHQGARYQTADSGGGGAQCDGSNSFSGGGGSFGGGGANGAW